jgi:hypothetical protein
MAKKPLAQFTESLDLPGWWEVYAPFGKEFTDDVKRLVPVEHRRPVRDSNGKFSHWLIHEDNVDDVRCNARLYFEVESD